MRKKPNLLTVVRLAIELECKVGDLTSAFDKADLSSLVPKRRAFRVAVKLVNPRPHAAQLRCSGRQHRPGARDSGHAGAPVSLGGLGASLERSYDT